MPVPAPNETPSVLSVSTVTIALGQSTSSTVYLGGTALVGIRTPAALDGTTMTFSVSTDGVTFVPLFNSAGQVSITVAVSRLIAIDPVNHFTYQYLRLVSGSTETAARTITVYSRRPAVLSI